jgi:guanosine-3',5'-bis(diphosphate) 3'-pyrophosphohydrolase
VLTNPARNPSRDWLNLVVTSRAKSKIRQWLNTQQKTRAMEIGRRLFEKEMRKYSLSLRKVTDSPGFTELLHSEGLAKIDDLYSRIGFGKTESRHVLERALGQEKLAEATPEKPSRIRQAVSRILPFGAGTAGPITVRGQGDLLAYLAKCCTPLPGEDIVGYVTRGRGVSVHRVDCPNVQNLLYNPEREIEVKWEQGKSDVYQVSLTIEVEDQQGMLARLTEAITRAGSNITSIEADTHRETGLGSIGVVCQLRDRKHLDKLLREVQAISGVLRVGRRATGERNGRMEAMS